jgi:Leucine-rich repeat (LRR) protein
MSGGARLPLDVSPRRVSLRAARLSSVQLLVAVGVALLSLACNPKGEFREPGLPADLPEYLPQIRALKLPATVENLGWIPSGLKELDASGTAIKALPFVPMGLERLNLHATGLTQLPTLPSSIRELNISATPLKGPWTFPHELEALTLGGENVLTLEGLSGSSLLSLTLDQVRNLRSSEGLPPSLLFLSISDATFPKLVGIPPRLQELHLRSTQIGALKGLPAHLQRMTLLGNIGMEVELPRSLLSLTVDGQQRMLPPLGDLAFLIHLDLQARAGLNALPPFLRELRISTPWRPALPLSLRWLEIRNDWVGAEKEAPEVPRSLKHLDVRGSRLTDLSWLPREVVLETLDVSSTGIPIDKLPAGLRDLRYRFCPFRTVAGLPEGLVRLNVEGSTRLTTLGRLPTRLQRLDVSETPIAQLPELPGELAELDISNTNLTSLEGLRSLRRLRKVTVHAGQLKSLAGLPGSVTELRFVPKGGP